MQPQVRHVGNLLRTVIPDRTTCGRYQMGRSVSAESQYAGSACGLQGSGSSNPARTRMRQLEGRPVGDKTPKRPPKPKKPKKPA
jgi:hypothetical protein